MKIAAIFCVLSYFFQRSSPTPFVGLYDNASVITKELNLLGSIVGCINFKAHENWFQEKFLTKIPFDVFIYKVVIQG